MRPRIWPASSTQDVRDGPGDDAASLPDSVGAGGATLIAVVGGPILGPSTHPFERLEVRHGMPGLRRG